MLGLNALTVDLEEYFHATNLEEALPRSSWHVQPSRIEGATKRLLDLLDEHESRATFFVLGWVAERHPALVREIVVRGHEIACHGYEHELVYEIGPERFRADVRRARSVVEDAALVPVYGFRAPNYSITRRSLWGLEVLWEEGFRFDSSIFPIRHHRYGIPDFPRRPMRIDFENGGSILEFPMTTLQLGPLTVPLGGGAYLRFLPLRLFRMGMERLTLAGEPTVLTVHPWEIDADQPRQPVRWRRRVNHYHNLNRVESRLRELLERFRFAPMGEVLRELETAGRLPAWPLYEDAGPDRAEARSSETRYEEIEALPEALRPKTAPGIAAMLSIGKDAPGAPRTNGGAPSGMDPPLHGLEGHALEPTFQPEAEGLRSEPHERLRPEEPGEAPYVQPSDLEFWESETDSGFAGYTAPSRTPDSGAPADAAAPAQASTVPSSSLDHIFGGFQPADALELLDRRKWWLACGAACGIAFGVLLWQLLPPTYEATTEILVEPQGIPESYIRSTITVSVEDRINTLSQRVASHTNLTELIRRIGSERFDASGRRSRELVMQGIRDGLRVDIPARRSHREGAAIIELGYTAEDPQLALDVVREISALFIAENRKDREQQATATAEFLDGELTRLRHEVTAQEARIREFRMAHLGALPSQLDANLRELDRLDVALAANLQAQETLAQQIALRGVRGEAGGASETDLDAALRQAALDLIDARKVYTEKHPKVRVLRKQIESLQRQLEAPPTSAVREGATPANPLQREIDEATIALQSRKLEEKQLRERLAELQRRVEETPKNEQELAALTRDQENLTATYERVLEDKHDATLAREMEQAQMAERFKVLRPPYVPPRPSWPDPLVFVPGGLAAGLGLAVLLVLLAELRHPAFHSVHRVARVAGLPLFASIPVLERKRIYGDQAVTQGVDWRVVVHHAPQSTAAEQYRGFLPHYLAAKSPRVVLVTSATAGDGKSITSANLAFSLATDLGRRVLLIDADLRRASLHQLVGAGRGPGLTGVLRGEASLARSLVTPLPNLSVLPAGPPVRNPLALLSSEAFSKLRERACEEYDVLVIDSPPVMPVIDGKLLHQRADMVVFVVRAGSTPPTGLCRSLQEMPGVAGIVFNSLSPDSFRRYYQYDAYSQYAYPEPPEEPASEVRGIRWLRGRKAEGRRPLRG